MFRCGAQISVIEKLRKVRDLYGLSKIQNKTKQYNHGRLCYNMGGKASLGQWKAEACWGERFSQALGIYKSVDLGKGFMREGFTVQSWGVDTNFQDRQGMWRKELGEPFRPWEQHGWAWRCERPWRAFRRCRKDLGELLWRGRQRLDCVRKGLVHHTKLDIFFWENRE